MTTLNNFNYVDDSDDVMAVHVNNLVAASLRSEYKNVETLSATRTLLDVDTPHQRFDCNGANRIMKMPTADTVENHPFLITNDTGTGSYTLTLQNNGGTVTYAVLAVGMTAFMLPDAESGYVLIWTGAMTFGEFAEQASAPATPGTGYWRTYFKSDGMYYKDDAGAETGPLGESSPSSGGSVENLLLNSNFGQWTRMATPTTPVSMTDDAYNSADCWYSLVQGSGATIARDTGIGNAQYAAKLVAGGTTNRYGIAQIRRADVSIPLRGQSVTFQVLLKPVNNAGSGSRDYRVAILEWTGTADAVTSELVADWTSATFTTAGFFASTTKTLVGTASVTATHNTETALTVTGTVSSSCNNIIVFVWVEDVPTHASDYVLIGKPGLYQAAVAQTWKPDFREKAKVSEEVFLLTHSGVGRAESATRADVVTQFPFMRGVPTASIQGTIKVRDLTINATKTANTPSIFVFTAAQGGAYIEIDGASWSSANFSINDMVALMCDAGNGILLTCEL